MKKSKIQLILILLISHLTVTNLHSQSYSNQDLSNYNLHTVVIDPGHGGHDNGTSGRYYKEKDVALDIAKRVGERIQQSYPNINVIYTRTTDKFVPLQERARIANQNRADLFISIHCNGGSRTARGTETFVLGLHRTEENLKVAMRENNSILLEDNYMSHYGSFDPSSPEAYILFSMIQNSSLDQSLKLADSIEKEFGSKGRNSRGVKQAGFLVLRETTMPSVLIETGFLTNSSEEGFLTSSNGKQETIDAIFNAFRNYHDRVQSSNAEYYQQKQLEQAKLAEQRRIDEENAKRKMESNWAWKSLRTQDLSGDNYFVQLLVSKDYDKGKDSFPFDNILMTRIDVIDSYKYLMGPYKTNDEVEKAHKIAQARGFRDAYILIYRDGKIVR